MKIGAEYLDRQIGEYSLIEHFELYNEKELADIFMNIYKRKKNKKTQMSNDKAQQLLFQILKKLQQYVDKTLSYTYFPKIVRMIEAQVYNSIYLAYLPVVYDRRYSMVDLANRNQLNIRIELVQVSQSKYKQYFCVVELDAPFSPSILGYETLDTGLPKMIDEQGIPPLSFLTKKGILQEWTEPRPFWDDIVMQLNSPDYFG